MLLFRVGFSGKELIMLVVVVSSWNEVLKLTLYQYDALSVLNSTFFFP